MPAVLTRCYCCRSSMQLAARCCDSRRTARLCPALHRACRCRCLQALAYKCWRKDPKARPSFGDISQALLAMLPDKDWRPDQAPAGNPSGSAATAAAVTAAAIAAAGVPVPSVPRGSSTSSSTSGLGYR